MTRHQYGISALVSQMSFGGETCGSIDKCRLFSQASEPNKEKSNIPGTTCTFPFCVLPTDVTGKA